MTSTTEQLARRLYEEDCTRRGVPPEFDNECGLVRLRWREKAEACTALCSWCREGLPVVHRGTAQVASHQVPDRPDRWIVCEAARLAQPARPLPTHKRWSNLIEALQRELGLDHEPLGRLEIALNTLLWNVYAEEVESYDTSRVALAQGRVVLRARPVPPHEETFAPIMVVGAYVRPERLLVIDNPNENPTAEAWCTLDWFDDVADLEDFCGSPTTSDWAILLAVDVDTMDVLTTRHTLRGARPVGD